VNELLGEINCGSDFYFFWYMHVIKSRATCIYVFFSERCLHVEM